MIIIKPRLYNDYNELIFGFSTKSGGGRRKPYFFNLSFSTGDKEQIVKENRQIFFSGLGLTESDIAYQKQVHGDTIRFVTASGNAGESDALITNVQGLGLAISTADCVPVFLYNKKNGIIAGIHSGWKGTEKRIVEKTVVQLQNQFNSDPSDIIAYIGPSICAQNYEVGSEVAEKFNAKYLIENDGKYFLDLKTACYDMLINTGLRKDNIEVSQLCTYELKYLLHSFRRDGARSGRSLGVIALRGK